MHLGLEIASKQRAKRFMSERRSLRDLVSFRPTLNFLADGGGGQAFPVVLSSQSLIKTGHALLFCAAALDIDGDKLVGVQRERLLHRLTETDDASELGATPGITASAGMITQR